MKTMLALSLAILACAFGPAPASDELPYARDLSKDGRDASAKHKVVLVAFVGANCSYCETVMNEFLVPMTRNPEYQGKLVMRRVETTSFLNLRDFSGNPASHRDFAGQNGVRMVPTVMLFDDKGRILAKPLVGLTTIDYYGLYLDEAINTALGKVRKLSSNSAWGS